MYTYQATAKLSEHPPNPPHNAVRQNGVTISPTRAAAETVARNTAFVLGAQVVLRVLGALFHVYVVRRLGASQFGQYSAVMAYVAVLAVFTDLGLAPFFLREASRDREGAHHLFGNIVAIRLLLSTIVLVIAPVSVVLLGKGSDIVSGMALACAGLLLYAVQGPVEAALTALERLDLVSLGALASQLVFWLLGAVLLIKGVGYLGLIGGSLVGLAAATALLLRGASRLGALRWVCRPGEWAGIIRRALPFGAQSVSYIIAQRFDTLLMSVVLSTAAIGWYNAPLAMIGMFLLGAQALATASYPPMVRAYASSAEALPGMAWPVLKSLIIASLPVAVFGSVFAAPIVSILYSPEFAPAVPVLRVLLWSLPLSFSLESLGRVATAVGLEHKAARIDVASAGVSVLLNLVLVPTAGIVGAALALVLSRAYRVVRYWSLLEGSLQLSSNLRDLAGMAASAALMAGVVLTLNWQIAGLGTRLVGLGVCALAGGLAFVVGLWALGAVSKREVLAIRGLVVARVQGRRSP